MLTYRKCDHLDAIGYSYLGFVGCVDTRKSIFGYLYLLTKGLISWKNVQQPDISTSIMKAKILACFKTIVLTIYLHKFILGLGIVDSISRTLKVYYEKFAGILFSKNDKYSKGAKHMELKYFSIEGND